MAVVKLTATLTDSDGKPLKDKTITFSYSYDGVNFTELIQVNTDENGVATATHTTNAPTVYIASFQGDTYYLPSSSTETYLPQPQSQQQQQGATATYNYGLMLLILVVALSLFSHNAPIKE
jgi:YHS domain-containing protein